jgi:hypothetical protein
LLKEKAWKGQFAVHHHKEACELTPRYWWTPVLSNMFSEVRAFKADS